MLIANLIAKIKKSPKFLLGNTFGSIQGWKA